MSRRNLILWDGFKLLRAGGILAVALLVMIAVYMFARGAGLDLAWSLGTAWFVMCLAVGWMLR
jgi:hypothetical protein